jgi:undecaprenyl-diphosphatase
MGLGEAVIIGLVQGITEILPISSTAHILLLADMFQIPEPSVAATVFLNFGSFLAIILFFGRRWLDILQGTWRLLLYGLGKSQWYSREDLDQSYYALLLVLATLPALVIGYFFEDIIAETLRHSRVIAGALMGGGALLLAADFFPRRKTMGQLDRIDAVWIGLFQALALIPGFSRSGSAITGARFLSLNRSDAATFAFLMGAPVLIAAMVYKLPVLFTSGAFSNTNLWVAFGISVLSTYAAIQFIMDFVRQRSYVWFVVYRFILGSLILVLVW